MSSDKLQKKIEKMQKQLEEIRIQEEQYQKECELQEELETHELKQQNKKKKKMKVSNIMLVVVIVAILTYTIASFWLTYVSGVSVDSTLTTCFYTFFGSELFLLAGIKTSKVLKGIDDSQYDWSDKSDESEM